MMADETMSLEELADEVRTDGDTTLQLARSLAAADISLLEQLVGLRDQLGLTQKDVAKRMHRSQASVSQFERLGSDPRLSTIRRYALALGACVEHSVVVDAVVEDPTLPPWVSQRFSTQWVLSPANVAQALSSDA